MINVILVIASIIRFQKLFTSYVTELPTVLLLIWFFILTNMVLTLVFLCWIKFGQGIRRKRKLKKILQTRLFQKSMNEFLFSDSEEDVISILLNERTENKLDEQVMIDELIKMKRNFTGEIEEKIQQVYLALELEKNSFKKLNSPQWFICAQGIRELTEMNIKNAAGEISYFIDSEIELLRVEAITAIVDLLEFDVFALLERRKQDISEWEQIMLLEKFLQSDPSHVPDFSRLLHINKPGLVCFGIKLMSYFNQYENANKLLKLLYHKNTEVRRSAIASLSDLFFEESMPELKRIFPKEEIKVQVEILEAFGKMGTIEDMTFIKPLMAADDVKISLAASKAFVKMSKNRLPEFDIPSAENSQMILVLAHAMDERI